ncbi:MAG TPA: glycosyltransferase [Planctomycetaceae bacterium]|jgi:glycosyltransferase involved in cell wall biosynthesis
MTRLAEPVAPAKAEPRRPAPEAGTDGRRLASDQSRAADRRVQVVHLVLGLNVGGLEKVVYDLVRCIDQDLFAVRILCLEQIGAWGPKFEALGIPVENLNTKNRKIPGRVAAVARRLRELRPDVLHTHNPAPHLVGAIAARLSGVPVVVHTKHGRNYPRNKKWVLANRMASALTDKVIAVSQDAAEVALQIERIKTNKVETIWNGVDLSRFSARETTPPGAARRAIHVARISYPDKDQRTLLAAVRIVADAEPDFMIDLVGDGPDRADLEAYCDELQLRRNVNFIGFRDDVHECLSQAGFFVLSSVTEGVSLTLLEAAASGLPIVATRVGGNSEVVSHEETGLLVPPQSPGALAEAMLEMLRHPQRAAQMGLAGRRRIENHFDLRRAVARYEQLYLSLLPRKPGR